MSTRLQVPTLVLVVLLALVALTPSRAHAVAILKVSPGNAVSSYNLPLARGQRLGAMAAGADGNVWFVIRGEDYYFSKSRLGRMTPSGQIATFSAGLTDDTSIRALTAGPDGNVWFTIDHSSLANDAVSDGIGKVTPSGEITQYPKQYFYAPRDITAGSDGNLWVTSGSGIVRANTSGDFTGTFGTPGSEEPDGITSGPDGNLWLTTKNSVVRSTTSGAMSAFTAGLPQYGSPGEIVTGPEGRLWFAQAPKDVRFSAPAIGRVTTSGSIDQVPVPSAVADLTAGSDGHIWAVTQSIGSGTTGGEVGSIDGGEVLRISTAGRVDKVPLKPCAIANEITTGPDGSVWIADNSDSKYRCPTSQLEVAGRGTIDKRGVASINVLCRGGDPRTSCAGVALKVTTTVRAKGRRRTVALGTTRISTTDSPGPVGRVGRGRIKIEPAGRRLLARSKRRELRVRAEATFGSATARRRLLLTGNKAAKAKPKRQRKTRAKG